MHKKLVQEESNKSKFLSAGVGGRWQKRGRVNNPMHTIDPTTLWGSCYPSVWTCRVCSTDNFWSPVYFLCISKVSSMLHHMPVGRFDIKEYCLMLLMLHILSWHFLLCFIKYLLFFHFHFFFWWTIKFIQQNINQSEPRIGNKKFPVELYV